MKAYSLLLSPEARGAYFADYLDVARRELEAVLPGADADSRQVGELQFIDLDCEENLLPQLLRLSWVQGVFERDDDALRPVDAAPAFALHQDFVFAAKYRGKTHERLTQLLLNVGLAAIGADRCDGRKLLDPMCGRGTTLAWAMRYGMKARGIERDGKVLQDVRRELKKSCKLHRQKHQLQEGSIGKAAKGKSGHFLEFNADDVGMKIVTGDAREAPTLLGGEKFDLLVSDLPYGVQHDTSGGSRNPLAVLAECAQPWRDCLRPGGALVLSFNRYQPKRPALIEAFAKAGWQAQDFSAPHRMSEAIVRDVVVFK